jgi:hypothetical protein
MSAVREAPCRTGVAWLNKINLVGNRGVELDDDELRVIRLHRPPDVEVVAIDVD